jgi:hypothetical protein
MRRPGEWNWEGVWEDRVKNGISNSLSEPVMFGGVGAADDVVSAHDYDTIYFKTPHSRLKHSPTCRYGF